jgi:hypothetical protein
MWELFLPHPVFAVLMRRSGPSRHKISTTRFRNRSLESPWCMHHQLMAMPRAPLPCTLGRAGKIKVEIRTEYRKYKIKELNYVSNYSHILNPLGFTVIINLEGNFLAVTPLPLETSSQAPGKQSYCFYTSKVRTSRKHNTSPFCSREF